MQRDQPKPGEKWRHFETGEYLIIAIAHTESGEAFVVYARKDEWISFIAQHTEKENIAVHVYPSPDHGWIAVLFKKWWTEENEIVGFACPLDSFMEVLDSAYESQSYYRFEPV